MNEELKIILLTKSDIPELQKLFETSADYSRLIFNMEVQPTDAAQALQQLPKGKTLEDKFFHGIYKEEKLIGALDLICNYPEEGTWFIGLLLFRPDERGKGYGTKIFNMVCQKLRESNVKKIRISVADQNIKALEFWKSLGFKENGKGFEGISHITYFDYLL